MYRINVSEELAQAKKCRTLEDLENFCKDHNFHCSRATVYPNDFPTVEGYYDDGDVEVSFRVESRY